MTGPQAKGLPARILTELARYPDDWFTIWQLPITGVKDESLNRATHRLINDGMVQVRNEDGIDSTGKTYVKTLIRHIAGNGDVEAIVDDTMSPDDWLMSNVAGEPRQCDTCGGSGTVTVTPTVTEVRRAIFGQMSKPAIAKRSLDAITMRNINGAKRMFNTTSMKKAHDTIVEYIQRLAADHEEG